jgi:hypothetical protein
MPDPGTQFETRVSDFCKRTWDASFVKKNQKIDNREIDILVDSPNELIIIECTIERGKRKAETDISKIRETRRAIVGDANLKPVRGYFITQHDPSADVHEVAAHQGSLDRGLFFSSFHKQIQFEF